jgi:hypothetical protein
MYFHMTMQIVTSISLHSFSGKEHSLIISHLQRWSLSLNEPEIHHSVHKISLIYLITNKLGLLDTFQISLHKIRLIIPFLFRLSSLLRLPTRMLRTFLISITLVSCIANLRNLPHKVNKEHVNTSLHILISRHDMAPCCDRRLVFIRSSPLT